MRITEISNIVQYDNMGYPLLLCIMDDNEYHWIDINEKIANEKIKKGEFKVLEWKSI